MENKRLAILITSFVIILIGIALIIPLANNLFNNANTVAITGGQSGGTFKFDNNTADCTVVSTGNCLVSVTSITNLSTTVPASNYSICYNGGSPNGIQYLGGGVTATSSLNGQTVNITYAQSAGCQYVSDNTSRQLVPILLILFVIAVLLGGAYWMFKKGAFDF